MIFFKFVMGLLFFFMMMSLYFWWFSRSSSISLMMVLIFSVFSTLSYSFLLEMKVPLYMVVLTLSGGLFVLVSFVIMFFPEDYKMGVTYAKKIFFSCMCFFFIGMIFSFSQGLSWMENGGEQVVMGGMKVWGNYIIVYLFLIVLLFLFLFVLNWVVNPSTGSMFSEKKKVGVMN